MTDDQRLIKIETKIAYQEDLIQILNQTVIHLQHKLDAVEQANKQLRDTLVQMQKQLPDAQGTDEIPPHY